MHRIINGTGAVNALVETLGVEDDAGHQLRESFKVSAKRWLIIERLDGSLSLFHCNGISVRRLAWTIS